MRWKQSLEQQTRRHQFKWVKQLWTTNRWDDWKWHQIVEFQARHELKRHLNVWAGNYQFIGTNCTYLTCVFTPPQCWDHFYACIIPAFTSSKSVPCIRKWLVIQDASEWMLWTRNHPIKTSTILSNVSSATILQKARHLMPFWGETTPRKTLHAWWCLVRPNPIQRAHRMAQIKACAQ